MRVVVLLAVCVAAAYAAVVVPGLTLNEADVADWMRFETFQKDHARSYSGLEEKLSRFAVFQSNMRVAESLTAQHAGAALFGVTRFSDLTADEFAAKYLRMNTTVAEAEIVKGRASGRITSWVKEESADGNGNGELSASATPTTMDYNALNKVTPVRDQGECGCCFAFSAMAEYESQLLVKNYVSTKNLILSPQQIVDCDGTDHGCNGGFYASAWQYVYDNGGVMQEPRYPYKGVEGSCAWNAADQYNVKPGNGGSTTPGTSAAAIYSFLASHGPASAAIDATPLQNYVSGVITMPTAQCPSVNHAVLLTGYDSSKGYYRVKNSWSASWGESGFFRISTSSCGISSLVYGSTGF